MIFKPPILYSFLFWENAKLCRTQAFTVILWPKYSKMLNPLLTYCFPISLYNKPIISGRIRDLRKFCHNHRHISDLQTADSLGQATWSQRQRLLSALQNLGPTHCNLFYLFLMYFFWIFHSWKVSWPKPKTLLEREYFPWHWFCLSRTNPRIYVST